MLKRITVVLCLIDACIAAAQGDHEDIRESCRQDVAGLYLKSIDEFQQAKKLTVAIERSLVRLEKEAGLEQHRFETEQAKSEKAAFDATEAMMLRRIKERVTRFRNLENQKKDERSKATKDEELKKKKLTELSAKVKKVFIFEYLDKNTAKEYPDFIRFKSTCPEFRFLCPLPPQDRSRLLEIFAPHQLSVACQRYSQFE